MVPELPAEGHPEPLEDGAQARVHGPLADEQLGRDLLRRGARGDEPGDGHLVRRELFVDLGGAPLRPVIRCSRGYRARSLGTNCHGPVIRARPAGTAWTTRLV